MVDRETVYFVFSKRICRSTLIHDHGLHAKFLADGQFPFVSAGIFPNSGTNFQNSLHKNLLWDYIMTKPLRGRSRLFSRAANSIRSSHRETPARSTSTTQPQVFKASAVSGLRFTLSTKRMVRPWLDKAFATD